MLKSNGCLKFAEVDEYENGCIDSPLNYSVSVDYKIQGNTLDEVKQKIADFVGCSLDSLDVNACDDRGRIDAQLMENKEGYPASDNELALWKEGNCSLFAVTYSFQFDEVTRKPAEFKV